MDIYTSTLDIQDTDKFVAKLAELNRKAIKIGLPEITYAWGESFTVTDSETGIVRKYTPVTIEFSILKIEGWTLVGKIDHQENLTKNAPGQKIPEIYWNVNPDCDHCHTSRDRNETFIICNDGRHMQVGRQCLGIYLGIDPERALAQADFQAKLSELNEEFFGSGIPVGYDLEFYLSFVAATIREDGWTSRTNAQDAGRRATADSAWDYMLDTPKTRRDERIEADNKLAKLTVEWMITIDATSNDYLHNLTQIGANGYVTFKSAGFAASAIASYQKAQERLALKAAITPSKHIGTVGEKIVFQAKLIASPSFDSEWGVTFFHKFQDDQGNILIWKTGNFVESGLYQVKSCVKAHDNYKGEAQTIITRAKCIPV